MSTATDTKDASRRVTYTDVIRAMSNLNKQGQKIGYHNPTHIAAELSAILKRRVARNSATTLLQRIAMRGLILQREVEGESPIKGSRGFVYALQETDEAEAYSDERNAALAKANLRNVEKFTASRKTIQEPKAPRTFAPGRTSRAFTFQRDLWSEAEAIARSTGTPKREVLDTILRYYVETHRDAVPHAHEAVMRHFPTTSRPRHAAAS
jgi:hypothetical protein